MNAGFAAFVAALQLASAAAPETLVVKDANRAVRVPLVDTRTGPMLSPKALAPLVAVTVRRLSVAEYEVRLNGVHVRVWPGMRFVSVGDDWHQLIEAPVTDGNTLLVPLQFVAEIVPSAVGNGII